MAISLYDVSVASFQQVVGAASGFMDKAESHCQANDIDLEKLLETRLHPDMLPLRYQIASVAHHSMGAIDGAMAGRFSPLSGPERDYAGLRQLIADAGTGLDKVSRDEVEALEGKDVVFELGDFRLEFLAEDFLMTFTMPNLHFHATTAYDILRMQGIPLGKRDYMGRMRTKA